MLDDRKLVDKIIKEYSLYWSNFWIQNDIDSARLPTDDEVIALNRNQEEYDRGLLEDLDDVQLVCANFLLKIKQAFNISMAYNIVQDPRLLKEILDTVSAEFKNRSEMIRRAS